jgi:hypothetical protein
MKANMMFTLAAGLSLATSMLSATTTQPATYSASHLLDVSTSISLQSPVVIARESEPGDKRGKKDDGKGHKFAEQIARESEPGDKRGRKDDGKGHKFAEQIARESEPGDKRGRKDDGKGHKFAPTVIA